MIATALSLVVAELDRSVRRFSGSGGGFVVLSNLINSDGAAAPEAADKLAVFLVNIEREDVPTRALRRLESGQDRVALVQPPVHLSLLVMFAANYGGANYREALKLIEDTVAFFQARPVFNHTNTPSLDPEIDRLVFEIENLSITDLSNLWGVLGGRYVPSVLYRVRMITIDGRQPEAQAARVRRILVDTAPAGAS